MRTLINLIGEQPFSNLLPIRYLKPDRTILLHTTKTEMVAQRVKLLVNNCIIRQVPAYDFTHLSNVFEAIVGTNEEFVFNLTGGTKIMALAAFASALRHGLNFVYLQSEGRRIILEEFQIINGTAILEKQTELPDLISLDDFLRVHLGQYKSTGPHRNDDGKSVVWWKI